MPPRLVAWVDPSLSSETSSWSLTDERLRLGPATGAGDSESVPAEIEARETLLLRPALEVDAGESTLAVDRAATLPTKKSLTVVTGENNQYTHRPTSYSSSQV